MSRVRLFALGFAAAGALLLTGCSGSDDLPLPTGVAVPGISEASQDTPVAPPAPAPPVGDDDADDRWDDDRDDLDDRGDDLDDRGDLDDRDDDVDDRDDDPADDLDDDRDD